MIHHCPSFSTMFRPFSIIFHPCSTHFQQFPHKMSPHNFLACIPSEKAAAEEAIERPLPSDMMGIGTGNEPNGTDAKICLSGFSLVLMSDWQRCPILFWKVGVRERLFKGLDVYDDYFFDRDMVKMMNNCHSQLQYGSIVDCFSLKKWTYD